MGRVTVPQARKLEESAHHSRPWLQGSLVYGVGSRGGLLRFPAPDVCRRPSPCMWRRRRGRPVTWSEPPPPPPQPAYVDRRAASPPQPAWSDGSDHLSDLPVADPIPSTSHRLPATATPGSAATGTGTATTGTGRAATGLPSAPATSTSARASSGRGDQLVYGSGIGQGGYREYWLRGRPRTGDLARASSDVEPRVWRGAPEHATAWRRAPGAPAGGFHGRAPAYRCEERRSGHRRWRNRKAGAGRTSGGPAGGGITRLAVQESRCAAPGIPLAAAAPVPVVRVGMVHRRPGPGGRATHHAGPDHPGAGSPPRCTMARPRRWSARPATKAQSHRAITRLRPPAPHRPHPPWVGVAAGARGVTSRHLVAGRCSVPDGRVRRDGSGARRQSVHGPMKPTTVRFIHSFL